jgi:hypothetical protein
VLKLDLDYKKNYDTFSDLGNINSTGPGPARNFSWEHSMGLGFKYHWVLDDNLNIMYRYWRGRRIQSLTGAMLRSCEIFTERYSNLAISGPTYAAFMPDGQYKAPYTMNTRVYSSLLIRNDIPYRWRGRYNEDTDICLRALKDGWCTVLFNAFMTDKATTQRLRGGNTDEFYHTMGTWHKSKMLYDMHPDITRLVVKYGRDHHYVDYSGFKQELKLSENCRVSGGINNHGMRVVKIKNMYKKNPTLYTRDELELSNNYTEIKS